MCSKEVIEKIDNGEAMYIDKKRIIAGIIIALIVFIFTSYITSTVAMAGWEARIEQQIVDHISNPDVHMSYASKVKSFYTRQEAEQLKSILEDIRDIAIENQKDIKALLKTR